MKILVVGSRTFNQYELMVRTLDKVILESTGIARDGNNNHIEIISGGAHGADKMSEVYAKQINCKMTIFPADWRKHGRSAGFTRNKEMVEYGPDLCVAFRVSGSLGTSHTIKLCREKGIPTKIIDLS